MFRIWRDNPVWGGRGGEWEDTRRGAGWKAQGRRRSIDKVHGLKEVCEIGVKRWGVAMIHGLSSLRTSYSVDSEHLAFWLAGDFSIRIRFHGT